MGWNRRVNRNGFMTRKEKGANRAAVGDALFINQLPTGSARF